MKDDGTRNGGNRSPVRVRDCFFAVFGQSGSPGADCNNYVINAH